MDWPHLSIAELVGPPMQGAICSLVSPGFSSWQVYKIHTALKSSTSWWGGQRF